MTHHVETTVGGRTLSLETGKLAQQADGAVVVRYGDTIVLSTAVAAKEQREGVDFVPLTVDYEEKMYAAGKIPGGFIKREGRPTETAILAARLTDRPIRPLFPKTYRHETQVVSTVISTDQVNEPDILSVIGASAALSISSIPFAGPVAAVRIGYDGRNFILNPTSVECLEGDLDLVVAGTRDAVIMVEGGAKELTEDEMLEAIRFAHESIQPLIDLQEKLVELAGKPKPEFQVVAPADELLDQVKEYLGQRLWDAINNPDKSSREQATEELKEEVVCKMAEGLEGTEAVKREAEAGKAFEQYLKEVVRAMILTQRERPDGRTPKEIRTISSEVGILPRTHGSGLFTRGQTQVLTVATLGATSDEQLLDGLTIEESKRYMHHYNFPPFSTGEAKRMRGPGRREIGHGALAERALEPVLPPQEQFPYVLRLVSEVLSSNGSSSMASVCGSTLALMDAGVPISSPVAGIAMGLITGDNDYVVLSDIQGIEDFLGDMDFKVAGTTRGVTAVQLDIKSTGMNTEIMREAFEQARVGRLFILDRMLETISEARPELSPFAPRIIKIKIDPEKIGTVIGPGGKMIRSIIDATGAKIDVEDDGTVYISTADEEAADKAVKRIQGLTREPEVGEIYLGKVVRIMPYGAFVEILPGKDGLVHISELAENRVEQVEDVVSLGDEINVMVTDVDKQGKVSLSRRAVLTGEMPRPKAPMRRPEGRPAPDRGRGRDSRPPGPFRR